MTDSSAAPTSTRVRTRRAVQALCVAAMCGVVRVASAQTAIEVAMRPLDFITRGPAPDPCRYSPCPAATLTLDALTGRQSPQRSWPRGQPIRFAVTNLNPFIARYEVDVRVGPLPDEPTPAGASLTESGRNLGATRPALPEVELPPCAIPDAERRRLRIMGRDIGEARAAIDRWLLDSLRAPIETVARRRRDLETVLASEEDSARTIYDAATQFHLLVERFVPAMRRSGLADSTRFVTLSLALASFTNDVGEISDCSDNDLIGWKAEIAKTSATLEESRTQLVLTREFLDALERRDQAVWRIASSARSFFRERTVGPFARRAQVTVLLYSFPLTTDPRNIDVRRMLVRHARTTWTLMVQ